MLYAKSLEHLRVISANALRQVLVAVYGLLVPLLAIRFASKEIWGAFVAPLLFSLFALQVINWGNKEFLLRQFSREPNKIDRGFSDNLLTRLPLVGVFAVIAAFWFSPMIGFWMLLWFLGRFLNQATDALVIYEKQFTAAIVIETAGFIFFTCGLFVFNSNLSLLQLLILYSLYQLFKGLGYLGLFWTHFNLTKIKFDWLYYRSAMPFFVLSLLGFLASKIDVYVVSNFADLKTISEYQIINSLFVFTMSLSGFLYTPFTKNIYRNNIKVIQKTQNLLLYSGLILVPVSLVAISIILKLFLQTEFPFLFYGIAFAYIFPSFVYGIDILNLFRTGNEKKVTLFLFIGVVANAILSILFLKLGYGLTGALLGSATAQLLLIVLFKTASIRKYQSTRKERQFYQKLISKNDLCFDIGANVGKKSQLFLDLGAKVIAFEPQSSCKNALQRIQQQQPGFSFHHLAVGAKNESRDLHLASHHEVATFSQEFIEFYTTDTIFWNAIETVEVRTLEALIDEFGTPDFCKIDTEGHEIEILLPLTHQIPIIEFEFTERFLENTLTLIAHFDRPNTVFNYMRNEKPKFELSNWVSADEIARILKSLSKQKLHGNLFVRTT